MTAFLLIPAILAFCPEREFDLKGKVSTTACMERINNCVINKAGTNEPTQKEFDSCTSELRSEYGSSNKIPASDLLEKRK